MNKSIGKILLVLLPIVLGLYLLYPTYRANQLEQIQAQYKMRAAKDPRDSFKIMESFNKLYGKAFDSAKKGRLKLGLDLRGGMYVTLEVDVVKLIEESASEETKDEYFERVIAATRHEMLTSDANAVDIFMKYFDQIARPHKKYLSDYFDFQTSDDLSKAEEQIEDKLRENEKEAIDQAIQVIRQRVDKYGIAEPTIQKQGTRRVVLELPGVQDENQMLDLLKTTARLEFKGVANDNKLARSFYKIDALLAGNSKPEAKVDSVADKNEKVANKNDKNAKDKKGEAVKDNKKNQYKTDTALVKEDKEENDTTNPYKNLSKEETAKRYLHDHPFTTLFSTRYARDNKSASQEINYAINSFPDGEYNFIADQASMRKLLNYLSKPEVKALLPEDVKIYFAAKPEIMKDNKGKQYKFYNFYACRDFQPKLTGEVITDAMATFDQTNNQPIVNMVMNDDGSERWAKITGANIGKRIAVILDDQVYTAPVVQAKIMGGSSQITGMENSEEAKLLKIVLKAGALKAPVQTAEVRVVGPSLGEDSIRDGLNASLIAFILVILTMIIYYSTGGLIADLVLFINVLLILAIMAIFDGTLSLPGIGGIILTLGMAVDANVLIYERMREEILGGRSFKSAIEEGYKKALSAIIDSNVTTFLTGAVLYFCGTGPVKGFAMTLMIGILTTMFTAVIVSKAVINLWTKNGTRTLNLGINRYLNKENNKIEGKGI